MNGIIYQLKAFIAERRLEKAFYFIVENERNKEELQIITEIAELINDAIDLRMKTSR